MFYKRSLFQKLKFWNSFSLFNNIDIERLQSILMEKIFIGNLNSGYVV
jgi:hypothetical protein